MVPEKELQATISKLCVPGKGILAADESVKTIGKRFAPHGIKSTPESRRDYRQMLFSSTPAFKAAISGVILHEETLFQEERGTKKRLSARLAENGAVVGIKVDSGLAPLRGAEMITQGLDGLGERLARYKQAGAHFTKWRAVFCTGKTMPSSFAIKANAVQLAIYARLCQQQGLVPIVEPETLMEGDHDLETCYDATSRVLRGVFALLVDAGVDLEGIILKPNMILAGSSAAEPARASDVAARTVACLRACVPAAVPMIAFLSGGQSPLEATQHLQLMQGEQDLNLPWQLSFSYGRALQQDALAAWGQDGQDSEALAQEVFRRRAMMNGLAARGQWSKSKEAA